jgi:hypothetical protein
MTDRRTFIAVLAAAIAAPTGFAAQPPEVSVYLDPT